MKNPKVSIVIPLYVIEDRFFEDLKKFEDLNYSNYEILIVCDKKVKIDTPKARLIQTKRRRTGPAEKRDIALEEAKGSIIAFIDDDAYPDPNWLKNAVVHFSHPQIAGVGGPGITPPEDGFWEQVTGIVYNSYFCGGPTQHRFKKASARFVSDYPAYNLLIRKSVMKKVGGYGSHFYGGEDTFLCLKINKLGLKLIYDPEIVVYHHRRAMGKPYLKQIANIGKHRGYFARVYPENSRYLVYFLPSIIFLGLFSGLILSIIIPGFMYVYLLGITFYYIACLLSVVGKTNLKIALFAGMGIIATHLTYGFMFIRGLLTRELIR